MKKYIEKKCIIEYDRIVIQLLDTRDNYIYPKALGNIGQIILSKSGTLVYPTYGYDEKLDKLKEIKLYQAFKEIFGTEEYNPLSSEYYQIIKIMIENGTLQSLGYEILPDEYEEEETVSYHSSRH